MIDQIKLPVLHHCPLVWVWSQLTWVWWVTEAASEAHILRNLILFRSLYSITSCITFSLVYAILLIVVWVMDWGY